MSEQSEPLRSRVSFEDDLADAQWARWLLRNDTFAGNLGLFRPKNGRFFRQLLLSSDGSPRWRRIGSLSKQTKEMPPDL